jgi:hypothetical protein
MTIQELLGGVSLTGLVKKTPTGIPVQIPEAFLTPTRRNEGPVLLYYVESGHGQCAQIIHYDAPPKSAGKDNVAMKTAAMIHGSHFHDYSIMDTQNLLAADGSPARQFGEYELGRQTASLKARFSNLRIAAATMALCKGVIYADADGNLLPSSAGAVFTIDFQIPAGHKGQLDVYGSGAIIAASWATASTDIPAHIEGVQNAALEQTGLPITTAIYGKDIFGYFAANNFVKELLKADSGLATSFRARQIPSGFLGIRDWVKASGAGYRNAAGTWTTMVPGDAVVFLPDPSPQWWDMVEGSYLVPRNLSNVSADAIQAAADVEKVYGQYGYAKLRDEPIQVRQIVGDTFMPMISNNLATYIADVVP